MTTRSPFKEVHRWTIAGVGLALLAFGPSAWAQQANNNRNNDDSKSNSQSNSDLNDDDQSNQDSDQNRNNKDNSQQGQKNQSSQHRHASQSQDQQRSNANDQNQQNRQQGNQQSWQQPNSQQQNGQNQSQLGGQHYQQQPNGTQQTFNAYSAGSQSPTADQQYTRYNQNQYGQPQAQGWQQNQNWQQNQGQPQYWQQNQNQQGQDWQQRQFSQNPNQFNQQFGSQGQNGQQDPNQNWQNNGQQNQQGNEGPLGVTLAAHPTHGVQVTEVSPNTPASHAGLQVGDQIVAVNGQHIYSNEDLIRQIHQAGPQQGPLNLTVHRNGQTQHIQAALAAHGPVNNGNAGNNFGGNNFAGNQGSYMRERPALGITMHQSGPNQVRISNVFPGSPAQRAGLQQGDRLISVDHQPVTNENDVMNAVAQSHPDQRLPIEVERNGQLGTIWTMPEQADQVFGQGNNR